MRCPLRRGVVAGATVVATIGTCSALISSPRLGGNWIEKYASPRWDISAPNCYRPVAGTDPLCKGYSRPSLRCSMKKPGDHSSGRSMASIKGYMESGKKWLVNAAIAGTLIGGLALSSLPGSAIATDAAQSKEIALCLLNSCQKELASCVLNPKCFANIICLQTCNGRPDEGFCQIRCGDLFENESVGKFNACAVSAKKCVKQRQDDGSYPVPPASSLVKKFDPAMMTGRWYISAGLNSAFDTFDCQVHFFTNPEPRKLLAQLNWRIKEPDGEFFTRDVVQKFTQDKKNPAVLINKDNEYLHYKDTWYVLDAEENSHVLIYYRGSNDAWDGYGGAVLYTKDKTVPKALVPRLRQACAQANIDWDKFIANDNSCKPQDREKQFLLREQYASKIFLSESEALQEQLTAVRGFAKSEVEGVEKSALDKLENLREEYVREIETLETEVSTIEGEIEGAVEKEVKELVSEASTEVKSIKSGAREFERVMGNEVWKVREESTLDRLTKKLR